MGQFAKQIIYKSLDTGTELYSMSSSLKKFFEENYELIQKVMSGSEVSALDFLELYNKRIYDIHSKQNDIKYMKNLDFKGLYCIKNLTKKKYYIGRGDKVFRKVDRHFRSYGHQEIFDDFKDEDKFTVMFWKLDGSGFDNLGGLEKETKKSLCFEFEGYQCYDVLSTIQTDREHDIPDKEQEADVKSNVAIEKNNIKELKKKRRKAFWFNRKRIALDVSVTDFVGKMYKDVSERLIKNGFTNIDTVPVKDIYTDSGYSPGEVEKIVIDGNYVGECGEMIPYDVKIMIIFHLKKEFVFPYSSRQVKKQNCEVLLEKLRNIGFTYIKVIPVKDLKTGWIVKNNSVEIVTINKQENYKKGLVLAYDTEIIIYYHTFK